MLNTLRRSALATILDSVFRQSLLSLGDGITSNSLFCFMVSFIEYSIADAMVDYKGRIVSTSARMNDYYLKNMERGAWQYTMCHEIGE